MSLRPWSAFTAAMVFVACAGATCENETLSLTPASLPDGVVDNAYSVAFRANGSNDGVWSVDNGQLPDGLTLNASTGVLSGRPDESGTFQFTIRVSRLFEGSGEHAYTLTVHPELELSFNLSVARQGIAYSDAAEASGGVPPYSFEFVGLPAGLLGDTDTGEITGTPIEPESGRTIQVTVTDSAGQSVTATDALLIKPPPVEFTTEDLPPGRVTVAYSEEIEVTSGLAPYTFAITDGALPDGLALPDDLESGVISGIPTEEGTFTFTITVTDADNPPSTASMEYTITVAPQ